MKYFYLSFLLCLASPVAHALEIPIKRGGPEGASVGYVDMEIVFREYPEAKKAREEYRVELARQKSELSQREQALDDLKREIELLKENLSSPTTMDSSSSTVVAMSSSTLPSTEKKLDGSLGVGTSTSPFMRAPPASDPESKIVPVESGLTPRAPVSSLAEISKREEILLKRQKELEDARASSAKSLQSFEASRAKTILGRLYKALVELAKERGIRLVVDKSAILYGENTIDLTESLNRRVRGLPEE